METKLWPCSYCGTEYKARRWLYKLPLCKNCKAEKRLLIETNNLPDLFDLVTGSYEKKYKGVNK